MKLVRAAILFLTAVVLFSGSLAIIFYDSINVIHLIIFYLVVIPTFYVLYAITENKKIIASAGTSVIDSKTDRIEDMNPTLLTIRSVFPLELFPDTLIVEGKTVTIAKRSFFKTGTTEMIPVDSITGVELIAGPLFASIVLKLGPAGQVQEFDNIWKSDAVRARTLIEELILKKK